MIFPEVVTDATEGSLDDHVTALLVAFEGVIVAVKVYVSLSIMDRVVLSSVIPVTSMTLAATVTSHVAVFVPALAVIVAVPALRAVIFPEVVTDATEGSLDDHVTVLSVAFEGVTVAISVYESSSTSDRVTLSKITPVTSITFGAMDTEQIANLPPASALIAAVPAFTAVTLPAGSTFASVGASDVHVTVLSVAFSGRTVADRL